MLQLGYACINTRLPSTSKTCRVANVTPERIIDLARQNLAALAEILRWNQAHGIRLFRISSGVIPLASHPAAAGIPWAAALAAELAQAGALIAETGARVSMHPGQYTVLNSPRAAVVEAALAELEYHAAFLDLLGAPASAKLVLHLGGVYDEKPGAMRRFVENFARLSAAARARLVLENDEKNYTAADALALSAEIGAPVVFDVFHHTYNPSLAGCTLREIVERCAATWKPQDGPPKFHYSDQWPGKPAGSHAQSVDVEAFARFADVLDGLNAAVMLEVKDKQESVLALYRRFPGWVG